MSDSPPPVFVCATDAQERPATATKLQLLQASTAADNAWMAEIAMLFGAREAGAARFHDRAQGEPGSRLRELFDAHVRTRDAYLERAKRTVDRFAGK
jgi:hypothetical protein